MSNGGTNQLARHIHDGIAQDLVALGYAIDQSLGAPELPNSTRAELRTLRFSVTALIEKVRKEILDLRNSVPDFEDQIAQICGDRLGILDLATSLDRAIQPIVIELLRNAEKHSGASLINLQTRSEQAQTVIEVSDNGIGGVEMKLEHFGLIGVAEAIAELSGQIEFIRLKPGLLIRVTIPH